MPVCCDCGQEAAKKCFSRSQIKKQPDKRRCIGCAIKLAPATIPPESEYSRTTDSQLSCFLCLDDEHTDGNPIVRDCACRGTAGYVHVDCLVEFAKSKSRQIDSEMKSVKLGTFSGGIANPWIECITCRQEYLVSSRSRIALASAIWSLHPDPSSSLEWHCLALHVNSTLQRALGNLDRSRELTRTRCYLMKAAYREAIAKRDFLPRHLANICNGLCYLANSYAADDYDRMELILDEASTYASKLGDAESRELAEAQVLALRSDLALYQNNFRAAGRLIARTIEVYRKYKPGTMALSDSLWRLSTCLHVVEDMEGCLCAARESLILAKASLGNEDGKVRKRQDHFDVISLCASNLICKATILGSHQHFDTGSDVEVVKFDCSKQRYAVRRVVSGKWETNYVIGFFQPQELLLSVGTPVTFEGNGRCTITNAKASSEGPVYTVKVDGVGTRSGVTSCIAIDPAN